MKTKKTTSIPSTTLIAGLALLSLTACGDKSATDESTDSTASAATDPQIEAVFVDSAPSGAVSVLTARKKVEPGASITVTGRIAGSKHPFSTDYATLILSDDSLETCERIPGDSCPTPWDACCVKSEDVAASRMTVQILGTDGQPVGQSLKNVLGLTELDTLVVTGTVAEGSSEDNLILNATGIHRKAP